MRKFSSAERKPWRFYGVALVGLIVAIACAPQTPAQLPDSAAGRNVLVVRSIVPASGAMNVDPSAPIVIVFNHPMMAGGQMAVALHDGTITGPVVDGTATWSSDHTRLTFTQRQPLKSRTAYIIHLSPTLADSTGRLINYAHCAAIFGGQPVSGSSWGMMMGGGMMGRGMTGPGWQAGGGPWGYGMWLAFTTA